MRVRMNDIDIRRARPGDFPAVTSLLRGAVAIRETAEFSRLCPGKAVLMWKAL